MLESLNQQISALSAIEIYGTVSAIQGLILTVEIKNKIVSVGSRCVIHPNSDEEDSHAHIAGATVKGEVVGFENDHVLIMPFGSVIGISPGSRVVFEHGIATIRPSKSWCGRVLNALAEPIDGAGDLESGFEEYPLQASPIPASKRARVVDRIDVGIRAVNTFLTCCKGQRLGIFAGSGVGKSMLLSMFARHTECDVCVIGLIGERGREVKDFIEETLGEEGLKRSVLVVATSDESPLMRRQATHLTLSIAEYFRDQGLSVLCLMDSVTRFAMAQREIGLSAGEPPTTKGYPPSTFAELPKLLERAGPGIDYENNNVISKNGEKKKTGYITALFTVLVDGDDMNEPIADAVRATLDGHIVLDRAIAERGRFPAINILRSVSRAVPACHSEEEQKIVQSARTFISTYEDMADMIRLGAYRPGSNAEVDRAIELFPHISTFLGQRSDDISGVEESFSRLKSILSN
ncbi:MAG: flagellar protein export ATPase FliI [Pseudomonadota bacterium]